MVRSSTSSMKIFEYHFSVARKRTLQRQQKLKSSKHKSTNEVTTQQRTVTSCFPYVKHFVPFQTCMSIAFMF